MNILCNPTGKKGHFRAIDWLVEHNNLFIKVRGKSIKLKKTDLMEIIADLWRSFFESSKSIYSQRECSDWIIQEYSTAVPADVLP